MRKSRHPAVDMWPEAFVDSLRELNGVDTKELLASLSSEPQVSIRLNPYKITEKPEGDNVLWNRYGFYLSERPVFTLDPLLHGGAYYVQEASSMFIEHMFRSLVSEKDIEKGEMRILDLCAAPGGKATMLAAAAGLNNIVVANETIRSRAKILAENAGRWGTGNIIVTNNDPSHFRSLRHFFDVVIVDAPCSGEGMFRKDTDAASYWSESNVELCASRQRRIISDIWDSLRPGGLLIYSTCTFNRRENEENVAWIARQFGAEGERVEIPGNWGILEEKVGEGNREEGMAGNSDLKESIAADEKIKEKMAGNRNTNEVMNGYGNIKESSFEDGIYSYRFFPHKVKGEGFFCSALRKPEGKIKRQLPAHRRVSPLKSADKNTVRHLSQWIGQPEFMNFASTGETFYGFYKETSETVRILSQQLSVIYSGVSMGEIFQGKLRPAHTLATFHDVNPCITTSAELEIDEALEYLRRNNVDPALFQEGINLVTYNRLPIGWAKRIGGRVNNMFPQSLRIHSL